MFLFTNPFILAVHTIESHTNVNQMQPKLSIHLNHELNFVHVMEGSMVGK